MATSLTKALAKTMFEHGFRLKGANGGFILVVEHTRMSPGGTFVFPGDASVLDFLKQAQGLAFGTAVVVTVPPNAESDSVQHVSDSVGTRDGEAVASVAADVIAERCRQVLDEGFSPGHDDQQDQGQLARAAACYAIHGALSDRNRVYIQEGLLSGTPRWPWAPEWWKPTDRRRDLVKAGALILAEIERLDRLAATTGKAGA